MKSIVLIIPYDIAPWRYSYWIWFISPPPVAAAEPAGIITVIGLTSPAFAAVVLVVFVVFVPCANVSEILIPRNDIVSRTNAIQLDAVVIMILLHFKFINDLKSLNVI